MGFNEKVHAYIAGKYYQHLKEEFGDRGVRAFIHGTQYYAMQRGRRMAQRAIRDGEELTQATYNYYGEWVNTEDIKQAGCQNKMCMTEDGKLKITQCPWYTQFQEMGLPEAGRVYCDHLDNSISRGFNPYLEYVVDQTLHHEGSDCCIHWTRNANIGEGSSRGKKPEQLRDFEYHCAHSYWAYNEVVGAIFLQEGARVNQMVLEDFANDYGKEMADILYSYRDHNFNVCD